MKYSLQHFSVRCRPDDNADAPAAEANGAVVGLIAVAVMIGMAIFLENSIVLERVNSALSINPLTLSA